MSIGSELVHRVQGIEALDKVSKPLVAKVEELVKPRFARNLLSGTYVGHPMHPLLTDVPIGAWTMATFLDLFGGRASAPAADKLVKLGVLAAIPTAATGLNDWSDTYGEETRIGLVHAGAVTSALLVYGCSSRARSKGHRIRAKLLGLVGLTALLGGGYLGGHLSFVKGVNVNRTAWLEAPSDWTPVLGDDELAEGGHKKVDAGGVDVLVVRSGGELLALANVCSHMGGPLDEGTVENGCVTCPWHGSVFRLRDGSIDRGPACTMQPRFETRVNDGKIEVRAAAE